MKKILWSGFVSAAILLQTVAAQGVMETSTISPQPASFMTQPATKLTQAQREEIMDKLERIHEAMAAAEAARGLQGVNDGLPSLPGVASEVRIDVAGLTHPLPTSDIVLGRNNTNPNANFPGGGSAASTLAEPAGANEGKGVLMAGNFDHLEVSMDGGSTWGSFIVPAGPAAAPIACCDWDIQYDKGRGLTIATTLYINGAATEGQIAMFVFRNINPVLLPCAYIFDEPGVVLMDFPHVQFTNDFIYLATNDIGGGTQNARMRRIPTDPIYDCAGGVPISTFAWNFAVEGQKVWRGTEGGTGVAYWAHHVNATTIRIFTWPEFLAAPGNITRVIGMSTFTNADCRGGAQVPQTDWSDTVQTSIIGFTLHGSQGAGKVLLVWPVNTDGLHPQAHLHMAVFNTNAGNTLVTQPVVFNPGFCWGVGTVSSNEQGNFGMASAVGGRAGGGGAGFPAANAASPVYGISDDFTIPGVNFPLHIAPAGMAGSHNRTDARYGDYFTIHRSAPCDLGWGATGYALVGGTGTANVVSRWTEFHRQRDAKCVLGWRDSTRTP